MTVLTPKNKKSSHRDRDKNERTRSVPGNVLVAPQDAVKSGSSSPRGSDYKKPASVSRPNLSEQKKVAKKVTFEKTPAPAKQHYGKPGCSGYTSPKPSSSHHQSEPKNEDSNEACNSDDEYGSGFTNDELEARFALRLLEARGLRIQEVKGDGACMFRAVAAQVYGDEEKHMDVRLACIEYIARNRDHFSQFITEDFEAYLARKRQADVHGNHVELQAISEIYGRQIEIYEYDTKPIITFHPITVEANAAGEHPPLMLSYHGNVHYNCVVDPYHPVAPINPVIFPNLNSNMHERINVHNALNASELTHIEEQMLNDKLKMTDYESTEKELAHQVAKESYMDYIRSLEKKSGEGSKDDSKIEKKFTPLKLNESPTKRITEFSKSSVSFSSPEKPKAFLGVKRGASITNLAELSGHCKPKMQKNDSFLSLPNIGGEFGKSFYGSQPTLLKETSTSSESSSEKPTCTKTFLNESLTKEPSLSSTSSSISEVKDSTSSAAPSKPSLYEELLASTVFDDDDETKSLAQALALSQQEYYDSLL